MIVHGATIALLVIGIAAAALSSFGVLLSRDFYTRLHYTAPIATVGVVAITIAVLCRESFSANGIESIVICIVIVLTNPVLTHATARAARIRRTGEWQPHEGEKTSGPAKHQGPPKQRRRD